MRELTDGGARRLGREVHELVHAVAAGKRAVLFPFDQHFLCSVEESGVDLGRGGGIAGRFGISERGDGRASGQEKGC